jgi:MFS family permease
MPPDTDQPARSGHSTIGRPAAAYLAATALSVTGTAVGLLGATGATTAAGARDQGAVYTGIYTATVLLASALSVPYAPRVCRRLSTRRAFSSVQAVSAAVWVVAGALLLLGAPTMPVLLVAAPLFGVTGGISVVLRPVLAKSYLTSGGTADAFARVSVVSGVAWAVGALGGGMLLSNVALGWGLVLNGVLSSALVLTVRRVSPTAEPAEPRSADHPWRDMRSALSASRSLRWTTVLGCTITLFVSPLTSLVVPISQDLRRTPLLAGSGLLMSAFAAGQFLSPRLVRLLSARREELTAATLATAGAGAMILVLGVASLAFTGQVELAVWLVAGIVFGGFRYAATALFVGSAAESGRTEDATTNLAAAMLAGGLAAPVGTLLWSAVIGGVSADAALIVSGVGAVVGALVVHLPARSITGNHRGGTSANG